MIRKLLVASAALAVLAAFAVASQPVEAACTTLSEKARGLKQPETADRSMKQLKRKINHWAKKSDYTLVQVGYTSTVCTTKSALAVCTSSAKVCG